MSETPPVAAVAAITINLKFLLRLSARLRRETINAHHRLLLGAHVNLTENTIVSPATWNMFSHA